MKFLGFPIVRMCMSSARFSQISSFTKVNIKHVFLFGETKKKMNQVKIMNNAANNMVLKPPLPLMKNLHTVAGRKSPN
jgi:hypothetical protein